MKLHPIAASFVLALLLSAGTWSAGGAAAPLPQEVAVPAATPVYGYRVVHVYPHDPTAFTQGLLFRDGYLYESTGLNGHSTLREVKVETGEVVRQRALEEQYFAEGLTDWDRSLIQLTWQNGLAFVYRRDTFAVATTFAYRGEGWGLTQDGEHLIMSDGSSTLRFIDPKTYAETSRLVVRDRGLAVSRLNELEFVKGEIWANVWQTTRIVRIAPRTGVVTGWIDLEGLLVRKPGDSPVDVMNGIAYDAAGDRLFVTGKWWPKLFQIELVPRRSP